MAAKQPVRKRIRKAVVKGPARTAGVKRATKFAAFSIVGTVLANATALAATALVGVHAPAETISVVSLLAGSVAAGVHKSINWVELGVDVPPAPDVTIEAPVGRVET